MCFVCEARATAALLFVLFGGGRYSLAWMAKFVPGVEYPAAWSEPWNDGVYELGGNATKPSAFSFFFFCDLLWFHVAVFPFVGSTQAER